MWLRIEEQKKMVRMEDFTEFRIEEKGEEMSIVGIYYDSRPPLVIAEGLKGKDFFENLKAILDEMAIYEEKNVEKKIEKIKKYIEKIPSISEKSGQFTYEGDSQKAEEAFRCQHDAGGKSEPHPHQR